jgi:phage-related baseplate assembly protein
MPSFKDLITPPTAETLKAKFVELTRLAGFPTLAWQKFSILRHIVETEPVLGEAVGSNIVTVATGGFILAAAEAGLDGWVDKTAENFFTETRKPSVNTVGTVALTDVSGVGPVPITANSFWVANTDKSLRFVAITSGTVPLNGSTTVSVRAESAGAAWNVGNGAITEILTATPGVTVSNPALDTGTWVTAQGADTESDLTFAERCIDKWSTLGTASNDAAYRYWASSVSSEIVKTSVFSPTGGSVRVYIAGPSGPVSSAALILAQDYVEAKRPFGVPDVIVANATVVTVPIVAELNVKRGKDRIVGKVKAQANVDAYARSLDIGGGDLARVSREQIIKALLVDEFEDMTLTSPAADVTLAPNEIFVPSYTLTTLVNGVIV